MAFPQHNSLKKKMKKKHNIGYPFSDKNPFIVPNQHEGFITYLYRPFFLSDCIVVASLLLDAGKVGISEQLALFY